MKIAVISGSHRANSQSSKVARYICDQIKSCGHQPWLYDLKENPLPLWDESVWNDADGWRELWGPVSAELEDSQAAVVIAPEWGGMVPAGLKNFFHLVGKELAHKPAMIVGVSASRGGSYPVSELRQSSYKNTFICYIPDHVIVRDVESVLNDPEPVSENDKFIRDKIAYSLTILDLYAKGLKGVRESGKLDFKSYPFGM